MDTADNFACGEESGDGVAVFVDYSGICINVDTAHGVVDAGRDLDRVERSLAQILIHAGCTAEIGIILISNILVPVLQCFSKGCGIYIDLFRKFFDCVALHGDTGGHIFFNRFEAVTETLVKDDVCVAAGLLQLCGGDYVAGEELVCKALAVLVDQNGTVSADTLRDQHAGFLLNGRMKLDLFDIYKIRADILGHDNTVAGDSGCAGGHSALEVFAILNDHIFVISEAAGCKNNCFGLDRIFGVLALGLDACHSAVFGDEAGCLCVIHDIDVEFIHFFEQRGDEIGADTGTVFRGVNTRIGGTA